MLKLEIDVFNKCATYTLDHKTEYIEDIIDKILYVARGYLNLKDNIKVIVLNENKEKLCVFHFNIEKGEISHIHF